MAAVPAGFSDTELFNLGTQVTALAFTPDGRLLLSTQGGTLRVYQNGALLPTAALTFGDESLCTNSERGLLGIAVHPSFATNHFIYLFYTRELPGTGDETPCVNRVSRFTLPDTNVIDPASELLLIDNMPSPNGNHNAGDVHFGKDGYLYITIGDGGPSGNARIRNQLSGKVLRITDAGGIPPTNPFIGPTSGRCNVTGNTTQADCQETFAWGLRNPFRMAFDPNAVGTRFFVNDTGQNLWEEIDQGTSGADYGWNICEGSHGVGLDTACSPPPGMVFPQFEYRHSTQIPGTTSPASCNAITGGAFVPNGLWPGYDGAYIFADLVCGAMPRLTFSGGTWTASDFGTSLGSLVHLRFGPWGDSQALYYTNFGRVRRISLNNPTGNDPPTAVAGGSPLSGPAPLTVTFDATGSSDPDTGDTLTYFWDFGDGTTQSTTNLTIQHTYAAGNFTATLRARDNNFAFSPPVTVLVQSGNVPPVPVIQTPAAGATFDAGQTIVLNGSASDPQDGTLPPSALNWSVRRRHNNNHWHPWMSDTTGNDVPFQAPAPEDLLATGPGNFIEISLTATDSGGLSATVTRTMEPVRVDLTFDTAPAGRLFSINGTTFNTATTITSWANWALDLRALDQGGPGGERYLFVRWSQGGAGAQTLVTPGSPASYLATFQLASDESAPNFFTLTPCRLVDTRRPAGALGGPALAGGQERVFPLVDSCGVSATAIALAVNVTIVGPTAAGFLQLFNSDEVGTATSTINFRAGATRANNAVVRLSNSGNLTALAAVPPAQSVHLVIDVVGWFE